MKLANEVLYEKEGDIGIITLNKPELRNTLDQNTLNQLIDAFKKSAENKDVCVIYQAEGKHFTVGADLKYGYEVMTDPQRLQEGVLFQNTFQTLTRAMMAHPGIIIVGYHGWIIGGGFEHTLFCDIRIAADDTRIMLPELGVGIFFSNASTKLLPQIIGEGRAKHLMIMGQEINAEEALQIGLVTQVVKANALSRTLKKTANMIIGKSHLALRYTKQYIKENQDLPIDAVLDREAIAMLETGNSEEAKKRITKFVKEGH